jgi:hypothetical protein
LEEILDGLVLDVTKDRRGWSPSYNKRIESIRRQFDNAVFTRDDAIRPDLLWGEMRSSFASYKATLECSERRGLEARRRHEEALEKNFWEGLAAFAKHIPDEQSLWTEFTMVSTEVFADFATSVRKVSKSMSWFLPSQDETRRPSVDFASDGKPRPSLEVPSDNKPRRRTLTLERSRTSSTVSERRSTIDIGPRHRASTSGADMPEADERIHEQRSEMEEQSSDATPSSSSSWKPRKSRAFAVATAVVVACQMGALLVPPENRM